MRVLLADAPEAFLDSGGCARPVLPMGIASLAAAMRGEHEVTMLLPDTQRPKTTDPWREIVAAISEWRPDLIGITSVTSTFASARRLASECARAMPEVPVVMGGVHASYQPREVASCDGVWAVVTGEGEPVLARLAQGWALDGRAFDPASLPGVWSADGRDGGPPEIVPDLDALPFPERDALLWADGVHEALFQGLITMRGCPYRCTYCSVPTGPQGKTRFQSARRVVDEVAWLVERYRVPYLFFNDSVFTLSRKRTLAICDELKQRGLRIPFTIQTRADRLDEDLLDRLADVGLHQVMFGIESGDAETLERIRKDVPLEQTRQAVGWVKARGLYCAGFFIAGFPWETERHIRATAEFACSVGLDAAHLFSATPLPGTALWEMTEGRERPEQIDFRRAQLNLTGMAAAEYERVFEAARERLAAYNRSRPPIPPAARMEGWRTTASR